MSRFLLQIIIWSLIPISFAKAKPWDSLIQKAHSEGTIQTTSFGTAYQSLIYKTSGSNHLARYFSLVGGFGDHHVDPDHIEVVIEDHKINSDKNIEIDQNLYYVALDSLLVQHQHFILVETPNRIILKHERIETSDEESELKWQATQKELYQLFEIKD